MSTVISDSQKKSYDALSQTADGLYELWKLSLRESKSSTFMLNKEPIISLCASVDNQGIAIAIIDDLLIVSDSSNQLGQGAGVSIYKIPNESSVTKENLSLLINSHSSTIALADVTKALSNITEGKAPFVHAAKNHTPPKNIYAENIDNLTIAMTAVKELKEIQKFIAKTTNKVISSHAISKRISFIEKILAKHGMLHDSCALDTLLKLASETDSGPNKAKIYNRIALYLERCPVPDPHSNNDPVIRAFNRIPQEVKDSSKLNTYKQFYTYSYRLSAIWFVVLYPELIRF